MNIEWSTIIARLKHHRQRLGLSKDDCRAIILERYNKKFTALSDEEIIDFGLYLKSLPNNGENNGN